MLVDALLALGLLLSTASQLRPAASPVGPGETLLVLWIALTVTREASRRGPMMLAPALSRMLLFWATLALALNLGTFVGAAIEDQRDLISVPHDTFAYLLAAAVSCMCLVGPETSHRLRRVAWLLVGFGAASLAGQVAGAWGLIEVPLVEPWYYNRFRGWSENPNQIALLCIVLAFPAIYLASTASNWGKRLLAVAFASVPLIAGFLSRSDAFTISTLTGTTVLASLLLRAWVYPGGRPSIFRFAVAGLTILLLAVGWATAVGSPTSSVIDRADEIFEDNDQGEARVSLWIGAVEVGLGSWLLGLGPGAHVADVRSGTPSEAHNTLLDLFSQGGLVASAAFVWLMLSSVLMSYQKRPLLSAMIASLAVFSLFHFIFRHPIFWFAIILCWAITELKIQRGN